MDFVLGWFATAAPRNVGAAVASATSTMSQHEVHAWEAVAGGEVTRVLPLELYRTCSREVNAHRVELSLIEVEEVVLMH